METIYQFYLYEVSGEPTDGSYMYSYVDVQIISASSQEEAIKVADKDGNLLGKSDKFEAKLIGISLVNEPKIISSHYTRDY